MNKYYRNYFWKEGIPYGIGGAHEDLNQRESYKIVMDPYRKRISIEKYIFQKYLSTIYDSALLNFRHLNPIEQQSWQKEVISETAETTQCLIRDQDDRVLFIESYFFEDNYCKKCEAHSPHGILLSIQHMQYQILGESENSVTLMDANEHPVLKKIYEADPVSGEFTNLLKEIKNAQELIHV